MGWNYFWRNSQKVPISLFELILILFRYCEEAKKFDKALSIIFDVYSVLQIYEEDFFQIFMAFSHYLNFIMHISMQVNKKWNASPEKNSSHYEIVDEDWRWVKVFFISSFVEMHLIFTLSKSIKCTFDPNLMWKAI